MKLIDISQQSRQRQGGFAIGLILLAVVLIAAIVAAIAVSTSDTANNTNQEEDRVNASTVVQQMTFIRNSAIRWNALGSSFTSGDAADMSDTLVGNTLDVQPSISADVFGGSTNQSWVLLPVADVEAGGGLPAGASGMYALANISSGSDGVCQQINNILWNISVQDQLGNAADFQFADIVEDRTDSLGNGVARGMDFDFTAAYDYKDQGCSSDGLVFVRLGDTTS